MLRIKRGRGRGPILERVVTGGPSDQETFEQKPEGSEGPDCLAIGSKCVAGRSISKCWREKAENVWNVLGTTQRPV